jgi:xanthine dehydrogenase accessory factor
MSPSAAELEAAGVAYVEATVVRCAAPTSALPGDRAIVLGDGTIEGFVGGSCADTTVRLQALRTLETGEPMLLRILPGEADGPSDEPGAVVVANPCLSGGALELFLEPHLPLPWVAVAGTSPVARALVELAAPLGFRARLDAQAEPGDFAAVVASLGHGDEDAVRRGLEAGCEYVGLVASHARGSSVLDALRAGGVADADLARVRTPAGVDIGARTHAEIALAILAELVAVRRVRVAPAMGAVPGQNVALRSGAVGDSEPKEGLTPFREAVDPVCGMTVAVGRDTPTAGEHVFCCDGCREAWLARGG